MEFSEVETVAVTLSRRQTMYASGLGGHGGPANGARRIWLAPFGGLGVTNTCLPESRGRPCFLLVFQLDEGGSV